MYTNCLSETLEAYTVSEETLTKNNFMMSKVYRQASKWLMRQFMLLQVLLKKREENIERQTKTGPFKTLMYLSISNICLLKGCYNSKVQRT